MPTTRYSDYHRGCYVLDMRKGDTCRRLDMVAVSSEEALVEAEGLVEDNKSVYDLYVLFRVDSMHRRVVNTWGVGSGGDKLVDHYDRVGRWRVVAGVKHLGRPEDPWYDQFPLVFEIEGTFYDAETVYLKCKDAMCSISDCWVELGWERHTTYCVDLFWVDDSDVEELVGFGG